MAIHFHSDYSALRGTRNFGDDINPALLGKLFRRSIIDSDSICLIGIGTILNERHVKEVAAYKKKIVFSSGAGSEGLGDVFDDTWHFACVRGPKTASALGLPEAAAICDGAVLLADFYAPKPPAARIGVMFVPHVNTGRGAGRALQAICRDLGLTYLSPEVEAERFIDAIRSASLVVTEAMHGAILADCMRTPWLPIRFLQHNRFKWEDWFASVGLQYTSHPLWPRFWDCKESGFKAAIREPYRRAKMANVKRMLRRVLQKKKPLLSDEAVLESKKRGLRDVMDSINRTYCI
jgi:succinoglycan biosynthesis protein ExoV